MATYKFLGPELASRKISASGGITYNSTFTVKLWNSNKEQVVWSDLSVNDTRSTTDEKMIKTLSVSPSWEEVV